MSVLRFPSTAGLKPFQQYFDRTSTQHPAKANCWLLTYLIQHYTKPGEVVLDPLAGTGSTGVMAAIHGRDSILIDLEEKFVEMMKKNVERVRLLKPEAGKITILKGDSRHLSRLLSEADTIIGNLPHGDIGAIITSPPYADIGIGDWKTPRDDFVKWVKKQLQEKGYVEWRGRKYREREWRDMNYGRIDGRVTKGVHKHPTTGYSTSKDNIGNLPIDTIITSPPYGNRLADAEVKDGDPQRMSYALAGARSEENIGRLQIDVITSPPYSESIGKKAGGRMSWCSKGETRRQLVSYSDDSNNIGNLKHGSINHIITSPPYADALRGSKVDVEKEKKALLQKCKNYSATPGRLGSHVRMRGGYSESEENIGNLPIDTIITSPPYSEGIGHNTGNLGVRTPESIKQTKQYKAKVQLAQKHMLIKDSEENIGSLPHGSIDSIITSPPYEDAQSRFRRQHDTKAMKEKRIFVYPEKSKENIGNLAKETYLEAMKRVYQECWKVLKPGGKMLLILKRFIRKGKAIPLEEHSLKICESIGFKLMERLLFKLPQKGFWRILYDRKHGGKCSVEDMVSVEYESILILEKQNGSGNVDAVLTSPPYAEQLVNRKGNQRINQQKNRPHPYSTTEGQIGQMRYSDVDAIITSPPYAESIRGDSERIRLRKAERLRTESDLASKMRRPDVWLSPTNLGSKGFAGGYSDNYSNIGNLPFVDAVITSPPFGEANRGGGIAKKGYQGRHGKDEKMHLRHDRPLSDSPDNISNLPYQE